LRFQGEKFGEHLAYGISVHVRQPQSREGVMNAMLDLSQIKITPRDHQVLDLLVQGCSNKEIAAELNISPRTVKQHLRTLFLRAGIKEGRKRVKLATALFQREVLSCENHMNL
jgi:DNA-binding NarL/FixJ family response regulator